jgi:hypothetical protein
MNRWKFASVIALSIFAIYALAIAETPSTESPATSPADTLAKPAEQPQTIKEIPMTNARIKFDENEFDFGSIQKGAQVSHNFWFTNAGTDDLQITKIKPACGCTTTKQKGMTVAPGQRGSIDISFKSERFNNVVTKSIAVETNDALNPYLELRFTANINNPLQNLEVSPIEANFQSIRVGTVGTMIVKVANIDTTAANLIVIEKPSPEFIKTEITKMKLKPKAFTEIKFTLAKDIPPGPFVSSITLEAEGKTDSRITIPILGAIINTLPEGQNPAGK